MSSPGGRHALAVPANLAVDQDHDENAHQDKQHPGNQSDEPGLAAQLLGARAENGVPATGRRRGRQRVQCEKDGRGGGSRAQAGEGEAADEVDGGEGEVGEDEGGCGGRHHEVSVHALYKKITPFFAKDIIE